MYNIIADDLSYYATNIQKVFEVTKSIANFISICCGHMPFLWE